MTGPGRCCVDSGPVPPWSFRPVRVLIPEHRDFRPQCHRIRQRWLYPLTDGTQTMTRIDSDGMASSAATLWPHSITLLSTQSLILFSRPALPQTLAPSHPETAGARGARAEGRLGERWWPGEAVSGGRERPGERGRLGRWGGQMGDSEGRATRRE
jgi:hypothetical protein